MINQIRNNKNKLIKLMIKIKMTKKMTKKMIKKMIIKNKKIKRKMINNKTIREPLKFTLFIVIATLVLLSSIPFFSNNQVNAATKDDEWNSPINKCKNIDKESDESSDDEKDKLDKDSKPSGVELGSDGAWLKKGTKQYEAAKKVYDTFTDELGTSGTFAVGVLGNINRESHFQVDIKEIEGGQNYAGRGYGLYQFTPAEKFLNSKEAKDGKDVDQQTKFGKIHTIFKTSR